MRILILLALAGAAHVLAETPVYAQTTTARADTIHVADFSDATIAEAFGLPDATDAHVQMARGGMRCGTAEGAILCNVAAEGKPWKHCANVALVGHFIVWFDLRRGERVDEQVYVAVDCGPQVVTMTSLRRFPVIEFTLATRDRNSTEEDTRTIVFITREP